MRSSTDHVPTTGNLEVDTHLWSGVLVIALVGLLPALLLWIA